MNTAHRNDKLVDGQRTEFVSLYSPNTTWGNIISMYLGLPKLRAYWPFSSVDESNQVYDLSGQSRTLVDSGTPTFGTSGLISYSNLVRASSQYFYVNDAAGIDFAAENLTILGWFNFDAPSTGALTGLVSKYLVVGDLCSYRLIKDDANAITFTVNGTGDAADDDIVKAAATEYTVDSWKFIAGRFTAQTELALFVNGTWYTEAAGIPAALFDTDQPLTVGRTDGSNYFDGQLCHVALCGYAVPNTMIEALYQHSRAMFGV